jgi:hypothetical protein
MYAGSKFLGSSGAILAGQEHRVRRWIFAPGILLCYTGLAFISEFTLW